MYAAAVVTGDPYSAGPCQVVCQCEGDSVGDFKGEQELAATTGRCNANIVYSISAYHHTTHEIPGWWLIVQALTDLTVVSRPHSSKRLKRSKHHSSHITLSALMEHRERKKLCSLCKARGHD